MYARRQSPSARDPTWIGLGFTWENCAFRPNVPPATISRSNQMRGRERFMTRRPLELVVVSSRFTETDPALIEGPHNKRDVESRGGPAAHLTDDNALDLADLPFFIGMCSYCTWSQARRSTYSLTQNLFLINKQRRTRQPAILPSLASAIHTAGCRRFGNIPPPRCHP